MSSNFQVAFVGIGSNLNNPQAQVRSAIKAIANSEDLFLERTSSLYSSPPMGPPDQPNYVNAVVRVKTSLGSMALLESLQGIEREHGRVRGGMRWGPRILDLDILLFGTQSTTTEKLQIPHPGMAERPFVVIPLAEIAPDLFLPNGVCVNDLATEMQDQILSRLEDEKA